MLYDDAATSAQYGARVVTFAVAVTGEALAMRWLKRRLLWAEAHQRRMAERDPLTGVHNRRAFDAALANAAAHESTALLVFDFNNFKLINDVHHGHPVGDAVLRSVALAGEGVIRDSDHLARIGGDEFALVARGAGEDGAIRLAHALDEAIREAEMPDGVGPVHATFAWAVAPLDGSDPEALLVRADARLLERKRLARAALAEPSGARRRRARRPARHVEGPVRVDGGVAEGSRAVLVARARAGRQRRASPCWAWASHGRARIRRSISRARSK